jgi:flavin-dependent dehydrogenase
MGVRDPVVCIVGADPAGLVTAHLLQRAGTSFIVLERQEADGLRARQGRIDRASHGGATRAA